MADASFWLDSLGSVGKDAEYFVQQMCRAQDVLGEMQDDVTGEMEAVFRKLQAAQEEVHRQSESAERGQDKICAKIRETQAKIKALPAGQDKEQQRKKITSDNKKFEKEILRYEKLSQRVTETMRQLNRVSEEINRAMSQFERLRDTQLAQLERSGGQLHETIRGAQNFAHGVSVAVGRAEKLASMTGNMMYGYGLKNAFQIVPQKRNRTSSHYRAVSNQRKSDGKALAVIGERCDEESLMKDKTKVFVSEAPNKHTFFAELDKLSEVEMVKLSMFRFGKFGGGKLFSELEARGYRLIRNEAGGYVGNDGMLSWEKMR